MEGEGWSGKKKKNSEGRWKVESCSGTRVLREGRSWEKGKRRVKAGRGRGKLEKEGE